ncbi:hypothetical protein BJQ90_02561 [Arthrobacter sp. SO3]|nr:hypothetical protein [Arthrobacter sp. SO3]
MRRVCLAALDGAGDVDVQLQRLVLRQVRHQAVFGASGQHLGDELVQLGKHGVAGGLEHRGVEFDVQPEEIVLVPLLACRPEPGSPGDQVAAGVPGGTLGGKAGGLGLDRAAEFVQRLQLFQPFGGGEPPADHLRIVGVPGILRLNHRAEPPS